MKKIAYVFTQAPHGTSAGREGLDSLLASSALCNEIALFFISDGVWQLLPNQQPEAVLARNYIATFGVLPLYDITDCFVCSDSLVARGLTLAEEWNINVSPLTAQQIAYQLATYSITLTF